MDIKKRKVEFIHVIDRYGRTVKIYARNITSIRGEIFGHTPAVRAVISLSICRNPIYTEHPYNEMRDYLAMLK